MQIQIEPHTLERAEERGASEFEILDILNSGIHIPGKAGRSCKYKVFAFDAVRNGRFYNEKKLEVYYIIQKEKIITITVCVFYGKF